MALRRYARSPILGLGTRFGTSRAIQAIRNGIEDGSIGFKEDTVKERDRLDIIAGREYGDATLWWVIAAASEIGWALQVPPDTFIRVPVLSDVSQVVG